MTPQFDDRKSYTLDDISVGLKYTTSTYTLGEHEIIAFAKEYDPQPFHTDPNLAIETFFGRLVASGWHTAAISMRLMLEAFPIRTGSIGMSAEIAWPNPTYAGDIIHVVGEVISIKPSRSHDDRGVVTIRTETLNQRNEVVQKLTANLLVFRREK